MKNLLIAAAGTAFIALASAAPAAAAMPTQGITVSGVEQVQYRPHRHVRRPVCTVKRVVHRGPHGRPIVKNVRVCR